MSPEHFVKDEAERTPGSPASAHAIVLQALIRNIPRLRHVC
jgi:hypothetical protein